MYRKAKQDAEERHTQAVSRMAERYKQLEDEKAAKRIVIMDKIMPDRKPRRGAQAAKSASAGSSGSAGASLAKIREQAKRARVALTHASGKYTPPVAPKARPRTGEQLFKNPYLDERPASPKIVQPVASGPRLPPPRISRPPQINTASTSSRTIPSSSARLAPVDLTTEDTAPKSRTTTLHHQQSQNTVKPFDAPIPGSYPTSEHESRKAALPDHLKNSNTNTRTKERNRVVDSPKTSKHVEFRRAHASNFEPPKKSGVVVDFFGDGNGAAPKGLMESLARSSGVSRQSHSPLPASPSGSAAGTERSSTDASSSIPMSPLASGDSPALKRKAMADDPSSVLFRKKPKRPVK